jgi:hypothetical protein
MGHKKNIQGATILPQRVEEGYNPGTDMTLSSRRLHPPCQKPEEINVTTSNDSLYGGIVKGKLFVDLRFRSKSCRWLGTGILEEERQSFLCFLSSHELGFLATLTAVAVHRYTTSNCEKTRMR